MISVEVLGPVAVRDPAGSLVDVGGPRQREVLARLVAARGRLVPLPRLIEDLWPGERRPRDPAGSVRTFVSALRAATEPDRAPGAAPAVIVTEGPGYAFRAGPARVDAERFQVAAHADPARAADLHAALALWRGAAYADFADAPWARPERARLAELRLTTVERLGAARLAEGRAGEAVPDLDAHVTGHPWREEGWRLLALALYRDDRPGDALAVLRRARRELAEQLGTDPGPRLAALESDVLRRAPHLDPPGAAAGGVLAGVAAAWAAGPRVGTRATLESAASLLRVLALHGGGPVEAAVRHAAAVEAAQEVGDPHLTARVIAGFDVPSIWTRTDDPVASRTVAGAAERTLRALGPAADAPTRVHLLTAVARETRGEPGRRGPDAAAEAERLARGHGDPALLAVALSGRFLHSFGRSGLAAERDGIGAEIGDLAARHGLPAAAVLAHLIRMQARGALDDLPGADRHAAAVLELADRNEHPAVHVVVAWYRSMAADRRDDPDAADRRRAAVAALPGTGMPGLAAGLPALALVARRVRRGEPVTDPGDPGPYAPWVRPHLLLAAGRRADAAAAVRALPDPPPGHLLEALWCLAGRAALAVDDRAAARRAAAALAPAAAEIAGAGSGLLQLGPVADHLAALLAALGG